MPIQKNIFEFADRFSYESPFGDWVTEEREKREEREKVLVNINGIAEGIFIYGLENEQQIKVFLAKIQPLVPKLDLQYKYQKIGAAQGKGLIYKNGGEINPADAIQKAIYQAFVECVRLMHSKEVEFYDKFNGNDYQLFNIEQYNSTSQDVFFIYAITHLIREYLWATSLKLSSSGYTTAHNKTLFQDLEIFSYIIKSRYGDKYERYLKEKHPNQDVSNAKWTWWEDLNIKGYLRNETFIDNGKAIARESDPDTPLFKFNFLEAAQKGEAAIFTELEFIDIESWEKLDINDKIEYVKIIL